MKKKLLPIAIALLSLGSLQAQIEFTTQTFDLESEDLHKRFRFYPGEVNENGEIIIKMGKPVSCDMDKNFWGDRTYKGVDWEFAELKFDNTLKYVGRSDKYFENTMKVLSYAPVFGKKFNPEPGKITDGGGATSITTDYIGKTTVVPTIALTGFKVSSFGFYGQVKTNPEGTMCWETIMSDKINVIQAKEEKGQKWIPQTSIHYPGGGDILFATAGVYPEKDKIHYVLKRYNESLEVEKSLYLPFSYNVALKMMQIEKAGGMKDYILVCQSASKYAKEVPVKPANFVEFIYIDGQSLEIKYRSESTLKYTGWNPNQLVWANNELIILGAAGKDDKTAIEMPGYLNVGDVAMAKLLTTAPKQLPNYQIMKVNHSAGKIEWVNATSVAQATPLTTVLSGTDKKAKATPIFSFPASTTSSWGNGQAKVDVVNDKIIVSGQQMLKVGSYSKPAEDRGNLITMIFDKNGKLEKYLIKPEDTYAEFQTFYSKDGKKMYWACYELASLNTILSDNGTGLASKKVPAMIAGNLQMVEINLTDNSTSNVQLIGDGQFAISQTNPVIADGDDAIVFMGRTLSKKAKNSELVIVKIKKG